jgi:hypothetical protein
MKKQPSQLLIENYYSSRLIDTQNNSQTLSNE